MGTHKLPNDQKKGRYLHMSIPYVKIALTPKEKVKWIEFAKKETSFGTVSRMVRHAVRILMQNPDLIAGPESFFELSPRGDNSEALNKIQSELKLIRTTLEQLSTPKATSEDDSLWTQ